MSGPTRRIIKKGRIQVGQPTSGPLGAPGGTDANAHTHATGAEPTIVLHREGNDIQAIEVTCACGKTIIIECEYSEETTP